MEKGGSRKRTEEDKLREDGMEEEGGCEGEQQKKGVNGEEYNGKKSRRREEW